MSSKEFLENISDVFQTVDLISFYKFAELMGFSENHINLYAQSNTKPNVLNIKIDKESSGSLRDFFKLHRESSIHWRPFLSEGYYIWLDIDRTDTIADSPVEPTCLVRSMRGFHAYWKISELDFSKELYDEIFKIFSKTLGADEKYIAGACMRIPGLADSRSTEKQFRLTIVGGNGESYLLDDLYRLIDKQGDQ